MTQEYRIWKPEHDGHAPPNWREGMKRNFLSLTRDAWLAVSSYDRTWNKQHKYQVPPEALNSPNGDAGGDYPAQLTRLSQEYSLSDAIALLRRLPAEELAKHGITLAPEKDWATELWADVLEAWDMHETAELVRRGAHGAAFVGPINLLRTRFEQMKGEG